jgi:hypothetical protein
MEGGDKKRRRTQQEEPDDDVKTVAAGGVLMDFVRTAHNIPHFSVYNFTLINTYIILYKSQ